ncbi:MAG: hypothetical protein ABL970_00895 [Nitrospira sp.]
MARAAESARIEGDRSQVATSAGRYESTCARCGGLMVSDFCMDLLNSAGELECAAKRCVQCGEIVDAVIQRNRKLRHNAMTFAYPKQLEQHT